jgi:hypothetical protein
MCICPVQMSFLAKLLQSAHDGCDHLTPLLLNTITMQDQYRPLAASPGSFQLQHYCGQAAAIIRCKLSASSPSPYSSVTDVMVVSWLKAPPSPSPRPSAPPAPLLLLLSTVSLLSSLCSKGSTSPACVHGAAVRCQLQ